ncbi:MAG: 16S rRNA (guanine(966)-N(2))-methyltransferase RsmD [Clostridia bacterium]|nr:16S rRNA (guanine(966)-N(2))-methyltransferase RsmD [Clostridia bacterium]
MRVISGTVRGMKLLSPEGTGTRPTLDRVKESVFNIIMQEVNGATVLDLFAGSGALGIEALSRGAIHADFADSSSEAVDCIKKNISNAKFEDKSYVFYGDSFLFLEKTRRVYDLIFLDPPYSANLVYKATEKLFENNLVDENSHIVLEWDYADGMPKFFSGFTPVKEKKYGRVGIAILKKGQ